jgi:hypothetical protein
MPQGRYNGVMSTASEGLTFENQIGDPRLDRTQFSVARLTDPDDAVGYWMSRPVEERLRALELLRRTFYGYTSSDQGLQRVPEVAQLEQR